MPHRRSSQNVIARFEELQPFLSSDDVNFYLDNEKLECLLCGRHFLHLGIHLVKKHGIDARAYKIKLNLPLWKRGLAGVGLRKSTGAAAKAANIKNGGIHRTADVMARIKIATTQHDGCSGYHRIVHTQSAVRNMKKYRQEKRKRARRKLLNAIQLSNVGESQAAVGRRIGVGENTIRGLFRRNPDLKAAFNECITDSKSNAHIYAAAIVDIRRCVDA